MSDGDSMLGWRCSPSWSPGHAVAGAAVGPGARRAGQRARRHRLCRGRLVRHDHLRGPGAAKPRVVRMGSDPLCMPEGKGGTLSEVLVVGPGNGLQNAFVYVKDGLGNRTFPAPKTPVVLDQQGCKYTPHVIGIQVGQPLEVRNSDATLHNVHAVPKVNKEFNFGQPTKGMKSTRPSTSWR